MGSDQVDKTSKPDAGIAWMCFHSVYDGTGVVSRSCIRAKSLYDVFGLETSRSEGEREGYRRCKWIGHEKTTRLSAL